ncbi:MAG TPA: protein translocase subunit SecD [Chloroflexi bacterium]|jgi:preprotein translocase subunit SecD|nr:protein translocase subunit SecD [Chloroflexota bacterium]HAL28865.1 protein translocase subunit SecD [Chloroflexota bacterium]
MNRAWAWIIVVIAVVAIWVDIPKHQVAFPFDCPGICYRLGGQTTFLEIKTHLGLDLQGGTQLVLQLHPEQIPGGTTTSIDDLNTQTRVVIDRRINSLGVSEPVIESLGANKILLQLPGVSDLKEAQDIATKQAFLEIKVPDLDASGNVTGTYHSLTPPLTGANLKPTFVEFAGSNNAPVVHFEFGSPDDQRWVQLSKDFLLKPVQINLDGAEISAPNIQNVFTSGSGQISGNFTAQSAKNLSTLLNSGALPVPLEVVQSSRVEPTLGQDSVRRSLVAGIIGLLLVALFMILYYRLPGVIAVLALIFYTALTYAVFRLIPVTLTLAGVAGFILSIGMAVDANVLTFERIKEELRNGKTLRVSLDEGRRRAFPSILYSNLATILTALVLFNFGTGTVKGFALTLIVGVVVSFFTAVFVTQLLLHRAIEYSALRRRRLWGVEERPTDGRDGRAAASVTA